MANKSSSWNWRSVINLFAFIAIVCIGIALLIGKLGWSISGAFRTVAEIIAYSLTAISAFFFANSKRHWAYYLIWVICVVLIVVLMIL